MTQRLSKMAERCYVPGGEAGIEKELIRMSIARERSIYKEIRIDLPEWIDAFINKTKTYETDEDKMCLAIDLARENVLRATGGPFGAAVFEEASGRLAGVGVNSVERLMNSTLHSEMVALMLAEASVESYTLHAPGMAPHVLATSCEPCAMCLGGIFWSGVRRVVCGVGRADAERLGFDEGPVFPESYRYLTDRGIEIVHGVMADEARSVIELYRQRCGLIYRGS